MTHYIYIATENSINEGQGYKSLEFKGTAENWDAAYIKMRALGKELMEQGWKEGCKSRSNGYCNDNYIENLPADIDWKDYHCKEVIASVNELALAER